MRRFLPAILLPIIATSAAAAGELSVAEAVQAALDSSPAVQAAAVRAQAAAARARQAEGHRLPQLDLSEIYSYTDNPAEVFA
ncbi:MAG TPA: TolC family protein, partial [Thermoanaerobaculales bacterium]|nr:TolC family protein [Thermoanaerobaculales bacterium]